MSEPENFLERWSRRKREAEEESALAPVPAPEQPQAKGNEPDAATPPGSSESKASMAKPFDLGDLPAIDSIDAKTDIRAFLQPGVPPELKRAALRRAWSADPEIRDFIGLVENGWDFNDPYGIPGFGPLQAGEDVGRLLAQAIGEAAPERAPQPDKAAEFAALSSEQTAPVVRSDEPLSDRAPPLPEPGKAGDRMARRSNEDTATQDKIENTGDGPPAPRRRQGGALPK
jgi:hypothetical protein